MAICTKSINICEWSLIQPVLQSGENQKPHKIFLSRLVMRKLALKTKCISKQFKYTCKKAKNTQKYMEKIF